MTHNDAHETPLPVGQAQETPPPPSASVSVPGLAGRPAPAVDVEQPPVLAQPVAPLLQLQGVYKYYRDVAAVQDVSFNVSPGEIVGLVGPNGAGKTTVLRCIAGVLRPAAGQILCGGHSIINDPMAAKPLISLVPETPNLYELLTVTEHLKFVHMAYGEADEFQLRADSLLRDLELWEKKDALVATLSKGMKQKLALACAFIHSSSIFLFDEPFIGIDPAGQRAVRNMIYDAAHRGAAIVVSSHILDTVSQLCQRVLVLSDGRLIAEGSLDELRRTASVGADVSLEDVFLTLTREAREA